LGPKKSSVNLFAGGLAGSSLHANIIAQLSLLALSRQRPVPPVSMVHRRIPLMRGTGQAIVQTKSSLQTAKSMISSSEIKMWRSASNCFLVARQRDQDATALAPRVHLLQTASTPNGVRLLRKPGLMGLAPNRSPKLRPTMNCRSPERCK
jgi:hypothetical protein